VLFSGSNAPELCSAKGGSFLHLNQLDLFCQVARVKSFSKAAKLLHISQPAISAQIHSMEEYYGIKLFERTPHGVVLTPAGNVLFEQAKQILDLHEDLERKLASMADEKNQHLLLEPPQRLVATPWPAASGHLRTNIRIFILTLRSTMLGKSLKN